MKPIVTILVTTVFVGLFSVFNSFATSDTQPTTVSTKANTEGLLGRIIYSAPSTDQSDTTAYTFTVFDTATLTSLPFPISNVVYSSTSPDGRWVIGWEVTRNLTADVAYNLYSFDGSEQRYLFHARSEYYVDSYWLDYETVMLTHWERRGISMNLRGLEAIIIKPFHTPAIIEIPPWSRNTSITIIAIEPSLQIALAYDPFNSPFDLFVLNINTNTTFPIPGSSLVDPDLSSTGHIAMSNRIDLNPNNDYENLDVFEYWNGTRQTLVDFSHILGGTDISLVKWSPDGELIAFEVGIAEMGDEMEESTLEKTYRLYVYDTSRNTLLSSEASMMRYNPNNLLWSPDNRSIAYIDPDYNLCVLNVQNGHVDCLVSNVTTLIDWIS